jgi:hypothetical protein
VLNGDSGTVEKSGTTMIFANLYQQGMVAANLLLLSIVNNVFKPVFVQSKPFHERKNGVACANFYDRDVTGWHILQADFKISCAYFPCPPGTSIKLYHQCYFLGHLSEEALATASITGVYYLIFGGIGFGLNNGLQALISRRAGENKPKEIGVIFQHGIFISLCIGLTGILLTYFAAPPLFKATIHSAQVYKDVNAFLRIRVWACLSYLFTRCATPCWWGLTAAICL